MIVKLSTASWHHRLQVWNWGEWHHTYTNLCPYFWLTIFCILFIPFRIILNILISMGHYSIIVIEKISKAYKLNKNFVLLTAEEQYLLLHRKYDRQARNKKRLDKITKITQIGIAILGTCGLVGLVGSLIYKIYLDPIILFHIFLMILGVIVGYVMIYIVKRIHYEYFKNKPIKELPTIEKIRNNSGLLISYLKASWKKICPIIDWKE